MQYVRVEGSFLIVHRIIQIGYVGGRCYKNAVHCES